MHLLTRLLMMGGFLVLASLTGCSRPPANGKAATQPVHQEELRGPVFRSELPALKIVATNRLPANKGRLGENPENCDSIVAKPETPEGKSVQAQGWAVFSEVEATGYRAISFAGRADGNPMGICTSENGNLALFKGGDLKAIIYSEGKVYGVGAAWSFDQGDLRIFDSAWLAPQPLADLRFGADGSVTVRPPAPEEKVCGGKALVPNIYNKKLDRVREMLRAANWSPRPDANKDASARIQNDPSSVAFYTAHGLPEVEGCGVFSTVARCVFSYTSKAAKLEITTNDMQSELSPDEKWDFPTVLAYDVSCP